MADGQARTAADRGDTWSDFRCGGMAERSMAVVLKTTVGETPPGVRIPLPPQSAEGGSSINYQP